MPGRPLNDAELASYRHLPRPLAERVRLYEISRLPGRYVGITLGHHVFLAEDVSDDGSSALIAHELTHVRQWDEAGIWRFSTRYVSAFLRAIVRTRSWNESYRAIPAEAEARDETTRWARSRQREREHPDPE